MNSVTEFSASYGGPVMLGIVSRDNVRRSGPGSKTMVSSPGWRGGRQSKAGTTVLEAAAGAIAPLLDGESAPAQPGQRQQLLELVVVLVEEKAPQFLEGR